MMDVQDDETGDLQLLDFDDVQAADTKDPADDADTSRDQCEGMPEPSEAHKAKVKSIPTRPNSEEVETHDPTHCPYRSWCPNCVAASAREDPKPRRSGLDEETDVPVISLDYELVRNELTILIVKDRETGVVLVYDCKTKGAGDARAAKQLVRDLKSWARVDIVLQIDGESAMIALQTESRSSRTVPRNPTTYNPQSIGSAKTGVQDVTDLLRRRMLALEATLKQPVSVRHPIISWLVRLAAFVLTRYRVGHDGLTAWR